MPKGITAGELMARLNADPEFVKRKAERDAEVDRLERLSAIAQAPLLADLRKLGYDLSSVWDLVNSPSTYVDALPVLLDHLQRPYPPGIREGIARALAMRESRFAWPILVRLYREEEDSRSKDGLAVAIAAAADNAVLQELIALARDTSLGESRLLLLRKLARSRDPRAREALVELGADPQLAKEVRFLLRTAQKAKT